MKLHSKRVGNSDYIEEDDDFLGDDSAQIQQTTLKTSVIPQTTLKTSVIPQSTLKTSEVKKPAAKARAKRAAKKDIESDSESDESELIFSTRSECNIASFTLVPSVILHLSRSFRV
jgi:hypothetical protein